MEKILTIEIVLLVIVLLMGNIFQLVYLAHLIAKYILKEDTVVIQSVSIKKLLQIMLSIVVLNAIAYTYINFDTVYSDKFSFFWDVLLTIVLPLFIMILPIDKLIDFEGRKIPYLIRDLEKKERKEGVLDTYSISSKQIYEKIKNTDKALSILTEAEYLVSNSTDYIHVVRLTEFLLRLRPDWNRKLLYPLSQNILRIHNFSEMSDVFLQIIESKLPIGDFVILFENMYSSVVKGNRSISDLDKLYECLKKFLAINSYSDNDKKKITEVYFPIFNDLSRGRHEDRLIESMLQNFEQLLPLLKHYLPDNDIIFQDGVSGLKQFQSRYSPDKEDQVSKWVKIIQSERKEKVNDRQRMG
jgi:hypothetical protein